MNNLSDYKKFGLFDLYPIGERVVYDDVLYESIVKNNRGNIPTLTFACLFWKRVEEAKP